MCFTFSVTTLSLQFGENSFTLNVFHFFSDCLVARDKTIRSIDNPSHRYTLRSRVKGQRFEVSHQVKATVGIRLYF